MGLSAQELHFVKDINLWTTGIEILDVAFSENYFFFVASNPEDNTPELWRSDGTERGTILLQENIFKTDQIGRHYISESINNVVYYQASSVAEGERDLWRTDGTPEGTFLLFGLNEDELRPAGFIELNGGLYFSGRFIDENGATRRGLYKTDGTVGGTIFITPLSNCSSDENNAVEQAIRFNDAMYWFYDHEACLYKSNGTTEGTGLYFGEEDGLDVKQIFPTEDRFYFVEQNVYFQTELYRSDGSPTGITEFQNTYKPLDLYAALGDNLIYTARSPDYPKGNDLWIANDSNQSASLLYVFYTEEPGGRINNLITFNNKVYFTASMYDEDDSNGTIEGTGTELWVTDGTIAGTHLVKDINYGPASSHPGNILIQGNKMYFLAKYEIDKYALFQSDGTAEGTLPYFDLPHAALTAAKPKDLYYHNNGFYLTMGDVFTGRELWRISQPLVNIASENNMVLPNARVIPNPFDDTAVLQFDQPISNNLQIKFFNQNGKPVNLGHQIENDHIILHKNSLPSGFYYYHILVDRQGLHSGKLIIH